MDAGIRAGIGDGSGGGGGLLAVIGRTASTSGSDVGRDAGCLFRDDRASDSDVCSVFSGMTEPVIPMVPPTPDDKRNESGTGSVRKADRAKVFVVEATEGSTSPAICEAAQDVGPDLTRVWFVGV